MNDTEDSIEHPKKVVRGGNTGIFRNGSFYSSYDSSCIRTILLRALKIDQQLETLDADYSVFVLGHEFETWFLNNKMIENYEAEKLLEFDIDENTKFEGHADAITATTVYEFKSISSTKVHQQVFRRGKPKLANVIQLVAYMLAADRYHGLLVYGSYVEVVDYKTLTQLNKAEVLELIKDFTPQLKSFHVTVDSGTGVIKVDGIPLDFSAFDIMAFWKEISFYLNAPEDSPLPPRPIDIASKSAGNSCFFCNKKAICAVSETHTIKSFLTATQDFINKRNTDGE